MLLRSPSKLNLFLKLVRKREDGYHDIASLFQAVSLFDFITLENSSKDFFETNDKSLSQENTLLKALLAFREKTGIKEKVSIYLEKRIPKAAGLGGGSSNAATTLFGLNQLFGSPLKEEELLKIGSSIGSDVPFFFSSGRAFCTGRGEIVTSLPHKEENYWIAKPDFGLSTPLVYKNCKVEVIDRPIDYFNDLEKSAFFLEPRMKIIKEKLLAIGFEKVIMTGSGSSFFCVGEVKEPQLEGVNFYFVNTISRKDWY